MLSCVAFLRYVLSYEVLCYQLASVRYSQTVTGNDCALFCVGAQYFAVGTSEH
jgi:hypothetical protein